MNTTTDSTTKKKQGILIGVCIGIAILMIVGALLISNSRPGYASIYVAADGYNSETSTPVEVTIWKDDVTEVINDNDKSNDPESLTKVILDANCDWELTDLQDHGTYTAQVSAAPILEDGTIYKTSEAYTFEYDGKATNLSITLEKLDLTTASAEEVEKATEAAANAAKESGSETKASAATTNATTAIKSSPAAQSAGVSAPSAPASSNNSGGSSSNSGASSNSGSSSSAQPSQPAHQHNWVAQTTTVTHPAVTNDIPIYGSVCNVCGANISGNTAAHAEAHALAGEGSGHHEGIVGYTTQVVTPAWTETITTGYVCSGCGATK